MNIFSSRTSLTNRYLYFDFEISSEISALKSGESFIFQGFKSILGEGRRSTHPSLKGPFSNFSKNVVRVCKKKEL